MPDYKSRIILCKENTSGGVKDVCLKKVCEYNSFEFVP